jgi:Fe-S cluster assembly protein SufB
MSSSVETLVNKEYKYGFITDIEADTAPKGLNQDIIRLISAKKGEPQWLLEWRLKAYRGWTKMTEPHNWPNIKYNPIDYQDLRYFSAPKTTKPPREPGRSRPQVAGDLSEARHSAHRAEATRRRGGGRHFR